MPKRLTAKFAFLIGAGVAWVTPAVAQDAPSAANSDIIVTARRTDERLQDVPIAITVFDQQALTDRNISDAQDLVNYTTALSTNSRFGNENATYSIRGFFQETGSAPSVGVYFAEVVAPRGFGQGIPAGDGAGPGSFFDLQNVQVLKGPQGTLFGRNTTGGAVLLVPQKPTGDMGGYAEGSIGNYGMRRVQAVLNAPITDAIRLRLGVDHQKRDGYVVNDLPIGPRDFNDVNYVAVRASLVVDLTPSLENYTILSFANSENNGTLQKVAYCNPNVDPSVALIMSQACGTLAQTDQKGFYHTVSTMPDPVAKLKTWQGINTTTWQANDNLQVKNIVSYARLQNKLNTPLYGLQLNFDPVGGSLPYDFVQVRTTPGGLLADQSTFTEELQFQGKAMDGALNWQAGLFFEDSRPKSEIGTQPTSFINCSDPDNFKCFDITAAFPPFAPQGAVVPNLAKTYFRSKAVYAQSTYAINDQLKFTGGFRYTWDRMKAVGRQFSYTFPDPFGANLPIVACAQPGASLPSCEVRPKQSSSAPTWLLGLDYKPSENMLLYAKYSRGYRTGGVKTDVPQTYRTFRPEKVDTYEIGAKTSFDGAMRGYVNFAAFYNNFSNQQINYGYRDNPATPGSIAPGAGPINVGKSRIYGLEVDAELRPFEGMVLGASYAYVNTKVLEIAPVSLPATDPYIVSGDILPGYRLPFTPAHKVNLSATYTLPLPERVGEVSLAANYSYTSNQIAAYGVAPAVTAYFGRDIGVLAPRNLVDLYLNWRKVGGSTIDLGAFVTNVTDAKYYTALSNYTDLGFATANVGQPRMYGVRARVSFGN